jgi:predicted metal-binding transcription factor (methanogenesis marker protein 9)
MLNIKGNPCYLKDSPANRVNLLAKVFMSVKPEDLKLMFLDGSKVNTKEKVS